MPTSTRPIADIARELGLGAEEWLPYGRDKAKLLLSALAARRDQPDGKLVVVSSITPTPAGDGKTTMTIGIGQALARIGAKPVIALREPSIGPTLGMKGGGTGGGRAQVVPMEDVNLHFTGDFHAVTSAHNLLAAAADNHLHHGNALGMDVRQVLWRRVLDVNDRALREVVVGLGGRMNGVPREGGFYITSASEIMAVLCLAEDMADLKVRLGRMVVALRPAGAPVLADELKVTGAMAALLRDAVHPNLVQTMEGPSPTSPTAATRWWPRGWRSSSEISASPKPASPPTSAPRSSSISSAAWPASAPTPPWWWPRCARSSITAEFPSPSWAGRTSRRSCAVSTISRHTWRRCDSSRCRSSSGSTATRRTQRPSTRPHSIAARPSGFPPTLPPCSGRAG